MYFFRFALRLGSLILGVGLFGEYYANGGFWLNGLVGGLCLTLYVSMAEEGS